MIGLIARIIPFSFNANASISPPSQRPLTILPPPPPVKWLGKSGNIAIAKLCSYYSVCALQEGECKVRCQVCYSGQQKSYTVFETVRIKLNGFLTQSIEK